MAYVSVSSFHFDIATIHIIIDEIAKYLYLRSSSSRSSDEIKESEYINMKFGRFVVSTLTLPKKKRLNRIKDIYYKL